MKRLRKALFLLLSDPKCFLLRLRRQFLAPSFWLTKNIRRVYCFVVPNDKVRAPINGDRMLFVYDTASSPITFDFLNYLCYADWQRRLSKRKHLDVLIVSRRNIEMNVDVEYQAAVTTDNLSWRITNLLVPLTRLFHSVSSCYITNEKTGFELAKAYSCIHPSGYGYATPKTAVVKLDSPAFGYIPVIRVSDTARDIIRAYFPLSDTRRFITITLRTYDFIPVRNSDIDSWVIFANELDTEKYRVIFIPDASARGVSTIDAITAKEIFEPACWNLELRAALYERSWMNMGVAGGPMAISALMDHVRTIMIDRSLDYPAEYRENIRIDNGITPGVTPRFCSPTCRYVLGVDNVETIRRAFNAWNESGERITRGAE